ncbi:MAG TPA: hypothetical protein VE225_02430, partial [Rubrobacteraceae bacterium]|nr:hypothetical protein [Rubrobacteraceae bacterium]
LMKAVPYERLAPLGLLTALLMVAAYDLQPGGDSPASRLSDHELVLQQIAVGRARAVILKKCNGR